MMFLFLFAALGLARDQTFLKLEKVTSLKQDPYSSAKDGEEIKRKDEIKRNVEDYIALNFAQNPEKCKETFEGLAEILKEELMTHYPKLTEAQKKDFAEETGAVNNMEELIEVLSEGNKPSNYVGGCSDIMTKWQNGKMRDLPDGVKFLYDAIKDIEKKTGFMWSDTKGRKNAPTDKNKTSRNGGISEDPIEELRNYFAVEINQGKRYFGRHDDEGCPAAEECPALHYRKCGVPFTAGASGTLRVYLLFLIGAKKEDFFKKNNYANMLVFMSFFVLGGHHSWTELFMAANQLGFNFIGSPLTVHNGCKNSPTYQEMIESLQSTSKTFTR